MAIAKKPPPRKVKRVAPVYAKPDELEVAISTLSNLKEQSAHINEQMKSTQAQIIDLMAERKTSSHVVRSGVRRITATIVRGSRLVLDEPALKKRLGADMWNKVTTRVLDRKKLDAFVASGEIDANEIAAASEEVDNAEYVKITVK